MPNNLSVNNIPKGNSLGHPLVRSRTMDSEGLDLAQMVMDVRKLPKITYFIISNNLCFNNKKEKPFPGTPCGQCPVVV